MADAAMRICVHVPQDKTGTIWGVTEEWHRQHGALAATALAPNVERHMDGFDLFLDDCSLEAVHELRDRLAEYAPTGEARLFYNEGN